ncbi:MAG: GFA family protein [Phenylobacterium sp.]|uniref:GFA family protein n=1 Tax=Phenylobacterium sp. TaxID=1871053 RepID=UPI001A1BB007|nr:GFA family protein [Phenylobacterium sp.]MBJ7411355.1 GFA family protein [Phenylobacterium sp.]
MPRGEVAVGACVCGAVEVEIGVPARWAWHDHAAASRHAHGAAYATYVGSWRSRFRFVAGEEHVTRYEDEAAGTVRSFCARCGTPLAYERARSPKMVNVPRALFTTRTGREPRYHMNLAQQADWTYLGEPLTPLKGYPGVMWERPRKKRRPPEPMF